MFELVRRKTPLRLLPTEQLLALLERAYDLLDERVVQDPEGDPQDPWNQCGLLENHLLAWELLRFVPMAAAAAQDVTVLSELDHLLEVVAMHQDDGETRRNTILEAVGLLAAAPALGDEAARHLATHAEQGVRAAAAAGFRVENPVQRELLQRLAQDGNAEIQARAKAKLARVGGVPWWFGCFTRDPAEFVSAEELEAHRAALEALAAYRRQTTEVSPRAVLEALPPALRADAAWCALRSAPLGYGLDPAWCEALVSTEEGLGRVFELLRRWIDEGEYQFAGAVGPALASLSPARRRAAFRRTAELLLGLLEGRLRYRSLVEKGLLALLAWTWRPKEDPRFVLEWLSSLPESSTEAARVRGEVAGIALRSVEALDAEGWALLFDVHRRGFPEGWGALKGKVLGSLLHGPREALRVAAQSAVASPESEYAAWGMQALLTTAFDAEVDVSPRALMERFLRDKRLRKRVLLTEPLLLLALPLLRKRLRLGKLKLASARTTLRKVQELWRRGATPPEGLSEYEKQRRAEVQAAREEAERLLPGRYRGPLRPSEWRAYRALRDAAIARNKKGWRDCVMDLRHGSAWHPEDEPLRAAFWELLQEKKRLGPWSAIQVATALAAYPSHEWLPLWAVLLEKTPRRSRTLVKHSREKFYKKLGVPLPEGEGEAQRESAAPEEDW